MVVPLITKRSKFGNPTLTIKVKRIRDGVDLSGIMDEAELERIRLAIESGIENLGGTLESVVNTVFEKIDALAEVRLCIDEIQSSFKNSSKYLMMESSIATFIAGHLK